MRVELPTPSGTAIAELDRPNTPAIALLVLTHGANGGVGTPDLLAVRTAAVQSGIAIARVLQPYAVAGGRVAANFTKQDDAWVALVAALRNRRGFGALPLIVGGRSNGARVACRTVHRTGASAVVALAFPLHPPGRPEASRLDELAGAGVPVLVVQGERDPFGMPPKGRGRKIVVIPGGDHSLRRDPPAVARAVTAFVTSQVRRATVEK